MIVHTMSSSIDTKDRTDYRDHIGPLRQCMLLPCPAKLLPATHRLLDEEPVIHQFSYSRDHTIRLFTMNEVFQIINKKSKAYGM